MFSYKLCMKFGAAKKKQHFCRLKFLYDGCV